MRAAISGLLGGCILTAAMPATAQDSQVETLDYASPGYDSRSQTEDWMIAPADTVRVGLETTMVTADGDLTSLLGTPQLALTDLVLLRASIGYSVAGKVELLAALSALPKQPLASDASAFQGGLLGVRVGLASSWALTLTGQGGSTIDGDGGWADAELTLDARYEADRYLVFVGHLGGGATAVGRADELVALSEVLTGLQVILQARDKAAVSTGVDFAFPFWSRAPPSIAIDPQTRVAVHVTGVLALADEWDVWVRAAVLDRGELAAPGTLLPVLDGGFDQQQLTLGVSYRSHARDPDFAP